jgi:DNA modification methylase
MKPYYQDDAVTIYHGDAREVLGEPIACATFDLLLTDPPYGIGEGNAKRIASRSNLAKSRDYGDAQWDSRTPDKDLMDIAIDYCEEAIIWGGNYFELPPQRGWLVWDKDNGDNDFADCELAWTNLEQAVRKFKWRWAGMLQENMASKDVREHPTQKPLALMLWCLGFAPEARTILDPFMGSGTTLRAAKDLGRKAIGIEIEERYCEIAAKRMAQEVFSFK